MGLLLVMMGMRWGDLRVDTQRTGGEAMLDAEYRLEIRSGRKTLLRLEKLPTITQLDTPDVDGDGEPELVVEAYTGGAHCCYEYLVLKWARDTILSLGILDGGSHGVGFYDLDGDGKLEAITANEDLAYFSCEAGDIQVVFATHYPVDKVYAIENGIYREATSEFGKYLEGDLEEAVNALREALSEEPPSPEYIEAVGVAVVALGYITGHPEDAWETLRRLTPDIARRLWKCRNEIKEAATGSSGGVREGYDMW